MKNELTNLEKKICYLENYIDELNKIVISQGKEIDILKSEAQKLKMQLSNSLEIRGIEKPPHY